METEQHWMRIFCKANTSLNVAVHGDEVILVAADPSDKSQHWIKDCGAVGKLTDVQGRKAFALVNRTTGQAMVNLGEDGEMYHIGISKYDVGPLQLGLYSDRVELSKLWTLGEQDDDGFSTVRVLKNLGYCLNAIGGPGQGTEVAIYPTDQYDPNSLWKIVGIDQE